MRTILFVLICCYLLRANGVAVNCQTYNFFYRNQVYKSLQNDNILMHLKMCNLRLIAK